MFGLLAPLLARRRPIGERRHWSWLFGFVRPRARAMSGVLALSVIASSLVLLQPLLVKRLIDEGLIARSHEVLWTTALFMLLAGLAATLLAGLNRYLHTRLSAAVLFDLRHDLFAHLQRLSPSFWARWRTGDVMSRLDGDMSEIQRFAVDSLFAVLSNLLGLVGAVGWMLWLSWELTLLVALRCRWNGGGCVACARAWPTARERCASARSMCPASSSSCCPRSSSCRPAGRRRARRSAWTGCTLATCRRC